MMFVQSFLDLAHDLLVVVLQSYYSSARCADLGHVDVGARVSVEGREGCGHGHAMLTHFCQLDFAGKS